MTLNHNGRQLNGSVQPNEGVTFVKPLKAEQSLNRNTHSSPTLLSEFLKAHRELQSYRYGLLYVSSRIGMIECQILDMGFLCVLMDRLSA